MGNESFSMNRVAKLEDNIQYDDQNENLTWVDRCYNELLVFKNRRKKKHIKYVLVSIPLKHILFIIK